MQITSLQTILALIGVGEIYDPCEKLMLVWDVGNVYFPWKIRIFYPRV